MDFFAAAAAIAAFVLLRRRGEASLSASAGDRVRAAESVARASVVVAPAGVTAVLDVFKPQHITDITGETGAASFPNPLLTRVWPRNMNFVAPGDCIIETQLVSQGGLVGTPGVAAPRVFSRLGPMEQLYWDPATVRVAIVTCGGLCPGLNTVIRDITMCLWYVYGTREIYGVQNGFRGFYDGTPWVKLNPDVVSTIHTQGGTILGSSRGGFEEQDRAKTLDAIEARGINLVFTIGGDGTMRGTLAMVRDASARRMRICIGGVPKTIDNDIAIIDKSFGFDSAVAGAVEPIACANTEAKAAPNGVGLVQLMGRAAGFIALHASMASQDVNLVLIPEAPWRLAKLLEWLEARLARKGTAVIVVAEGAQSREQIEEKAMLKSSGAGAVVKDASGNVKNDDVGKYLKEEITAHFKKLGNPANVKYIDPSYIIRSKPAIASDARLCTNLAYNVVHGAMAGYTGFAVGTVNSHYVMLPISVTATLPSNKVDITSRLYSRMCTQTGQPDLS